MRRFSFLIYGAGVIGSIFAGKLCEAGHNVTMLARGDRYKELRENGLVLKHSMSGIKKAYKVGVTDKLSTNDVYDYIFVVMQKTQVEQVLPVLSVNKSPNIVFIVNNPSGYDKWIEVLGKERIMVGFPSAGGEKVDGVVNYFIGKGINRIFQTTTFGELDGSNTERLKTLVTALNKAGIPTVTCRNMDAWQKTHVSVVTPIANAIYKFNGNNYELGKSRDGIKLMIEATREGFLVLEKIGIPITPRKLKFYRLPDFLLVPVYKILMGSRIAEIAMAKHANAARDEMKLLFNEFKMLMDKANIPTPAIDELSRYN